MRGWIRDNRGFLVFLVGLGLLRTAIADWNPIPSGGAFLSGTFRS